MSPSTRRKNTTSSPRAIAPVRAYSANHGHTAPPKSSGRSSGPGRAVAADEVRAAADTPAVVLASAPGSPNQPRRNPKASVAATPMLIRPASRTALTKPKLPATHHVVMAAPAAAPIVFHA